MGLEDGQEIVRMDMHTHTHEVSRLEVVETGRRRRWTDEAKLRIIAESERGPRLVSTTARRHGISPSQLFGWRREFGVGGSRAATPEPTFLSVSVHSADASAAGKTLPAAEPSRVEIELSCGRIVRVDAGIDQKALGRILDVVDRRR